MIMKTQEIVHKLWNLCNVLRDDGITYHQYVTELTYLLFLKMAKETGTEAKIPESYRWNSLSGYRGNKLMIFYKNLLQELGQNGTGRIKQIYANALTNINSYQNLEKIVHSINELDWYSAREEGLGDLYEGLLEKNAGEVKSGAGQYFTPRPLVNLMVRLIDPEPGERCNDPAAGTFGFMVAADRYVKYRTNGYADLGVSGVRFQREEAFTGTELVQDTHRLALMNALLHGIEGEIFLGDTLAHGGNKLPGYDVILTNPPFGTKRGGERPARGNLSFPSANKQLNFLQHIYGSLKRQGRAAVIVPDNVLFQDGDGQKVRADLMDKCVLHTVLRLPTGIFYAQGIKTNVLFFSRGRNNTGSTLEVWFYDLRTNMPPFGKRSPLTEDCFAGFAKAYPAKARAQITDARWSRFSREEIRLKGDNLDLGLMPGETGYDFCLTSPAVVVESAVTKLREAADLLEQVAHELRITSGEDYK